MVDFSNLSALREDGVAAKPYTFEDIAGQPTVLSRPATSANKRYNQARLKLLNKRTSGGRKKARISTAVVDAARKEDAKLLADFCAIGWDPAPKDSSGAEVPFSAENCREFFLAIPDWMFDDFRAWVSEPTNFVSDEEDADDEEERDTPGELQNSSQTASDGSAVSTETATQ